MVNNSSYSTNLINSLEASLSKERLQPYVKAANDDKAKALCLYVWNTNLSAALYSSLQGLEVSLRNALHRELTYKYGNNWYDQTTDFLPDKAKENIDNAKKEIAKRGKEVIPPRIVAELSFGFWVSLLGHGKKGNDNYETKLWRPALYKAFPNKKLNRKNVHKRFDSIRQLRNRIAHHEPIFNRGKIEDEYKDILDAASWICENTASWIKDNSKFSEIFAQKPN